MCDLIIFIAHLMTFIQMGLGLSLAFGAESESLLPTLSIVADASGGRLRCLLELRITLVRSLAQREYKYTGSQNKVLEKLISELSGGRSSFVRSLIQMGLGLGLGLRLGDTVEPLNADTFGTTLKCPDY